MARFWHGWVKPIVLVVLIVTAFRSAVADWNDVPTGSMNPTIVEGDRVLVNKLAYGLTVPFTRFGVADWSQPTRGDIVTFWSPGDNIRMVKRVVGVPGDTITVAAGRVHVNGEPANYRPLDADDAIGRPVHEQLDDRQWTVQFGSSLPHLHTASPPGAVRQLGPDEFYLLGDNRDNSADSRVFGPVSRDRIIGRATHVVLSLDRERNFLPRWDRLLTNLR